MSIPTRRGFWAEVGVFLSTQTLFYDLSIGSAGAVLGLVSAYKLFEDHKPVRGGLSVAAVVAVFVLTTVKIWVQFSTVKRLRSLSDLDGCLKTLHAILMAGVGPNDPPPDLRITVHVPINGGNELEQVVEYVCADDEPRGPKKAGRRLPAMSGAIGEALRTQGAVLCQRTNDNYELYKKELIERWHFTPAAAKDIDPTRVESLAVPLIGHDERVAAVLYSDVIEREFFTEERQNDAINASLGIARFVNLRYKDSR